MVSSSLVLSSNEDDWVGLPLVLSSNEDGVIGSSLVLSSKEGDGLGLLLVLSSNEDGVIGSSLVLFSKDGIGLFLVLKADFELLLLVFLFPSHQSSSVVVGSSVLFRLYNSRGN